MDTETFSCPEPAWRVNRIDALPRGRLIYTRAIPTKRMPPL